MHAAFLKKTTGSVAPEEAQALYARARNGTDPLRLSKDSAAPYRDVPDVMSAGEWRDGNEADDLNDIDNDSFLQ